MSTPIPKSKRPLPKGKPLGRWPNLNDHDELITDFYALASRYSTANGVDIAVVLRCAIYQLSVEVLLSGGVTENHLVGVIALAGQGAIELAGDPVIQSACAEIAQ